jgi:N-acetylgalactosamine kinase
VIDGTYPLSEWLERLADPDSQVLGIVIANRGCDENEARRLAGWYLKLINSLKESYELADDASVMLMRSPGRVNLLGTHVDHRGGRVNPIAINETILAASLRSDKIIRASSTDPAHMDDEASFDDLLPDGPISQEDWSNWTIAHSHSFGEKGWAGRWSTYVKAAVAYFVNRHRHDQDLHGFDVMVDGDIPRAAGLSSSSSLVIGTAQLMLRLNSLPIDEAQFIEDCGRAEWYVGTRGGAGDHAAITWGRQGQVSHIDMLPMVPSWSPMPAGIKIIVFHSRVEAAKSGNAQSAFNQRVATYEVALSWVKRLRPKWAPLLEHIRDVNSETLGVHDTDIYEVLKQLPTRASRSEILDALPDDVEAMERWFSLHDDPPDGYHVRDVCLYGLAECARSRLLEGRLREGDIDGAGELLDLSHDGDRVTAIDGDSTREAFNPGVDDDEIDGLIAALDSGDSELALVAQVWHQPGGYTASCEELDEMVDIARSIEGVAAAGLIGAGLGGCMLVMAADEVVDEVIDTMHSKYFTSRSLEPFAEVCVPVAGAGPMRLP